MAIAYISTENVNNGATVTVPAGTTIAIAYSVRLNGYPAIDTPTLNGTPMSVGAKSSDYVGIYYVNSPVAGTYTLSTATDRCRFLYLSGTNDIRAGALGSSTGTNPLSTTITSSIDDFLLLVGFRVLGTDYSNISSMTVDGAAVTYLDNYYKGYKQSSGDSPNIGITFSSGGGYTLYYCVVSVKSLVASDQSTFMTMIV
jgi:hypothetical protein